MGRRKRYSTEFKREALRRVTGAPTQPCVLCDSERRRGDDLFDGAIGDVVDETGHDKGVGWSRCLAEPRDVVSDALGRVSYRHCRRDFVGFDPKPLGESLLG